MSLGKAIGIGNTASVYEWEDGKVVKLFHPGYPNNSIENEFSNARSINDMNFPKPKAYELISYDQRAGIIYDLVKGESLLDLVMKTGDVQDCANSMATLHKIVLNNNINGVPNYKDFLRFHISNSFITLDEKEKALRKIDHLPDGNTLCHGDFHPGNIIISGETAYVIDFMNICHGDYLYDVARTVFLVEYTPVPIDAMDRDMLIQMKKSLADLYLMNMNVTREMIQDYLSVIITARKGECPNE